MISYKSSSRVLFKQRDCFLRKRRDVLRRRALVWIRRQTTVDKASKLGRSPFRERRERRARRRTSRESQSAGGFVQRDT
jgi:hypothetical protein